MVCSESIWVNTCRKRSHILRFKQLNSTFVPYHQKPHMKEKLSCCLLVVFPADVLLFQNTKPFNLLLFEFASCCWGVVLLYEVGWTMFWLESSVAVLWFGFTWGQDALTGKQTCVMPAEMWDCSVNSVYHRVPHMEKCWFICGNTQLLGGHLGCWGQ